MAGMTSEASASNVVRYDLRFRLAALWLLCLGFLPALFRLSGCCLYYRNLIGVWFLYAFSRLSVGFPAVLCRLSLGFLQAIRGRLNVSSTFISIPLGITCRWLCNKKIQIRRTNIGSTCAVVTSLLPRIPCLHEPFKCYKYNCIIIARSNSKKIYSTMLQCYGFQFSFFYLQYENIILVSRHLEQPRLPGRICSKG